MLFRHALATALIPGFCCLAAIADDFCIDFTKTANADFKDEKPGDGKGGWSDQGAENDMRSFDVFRKEYEGITFKIVNPAANNGRAVMSFDSPNFATGLKAAKADLEKEAPKASYLYMLHTSCFNSEPAGTVVGTVEVLFKNGGGICREITNGRDITDWWSAGDLPNGKVVVRKSNGSAEVGIFLSRIEFPEKGVQVKSVEFKTRGKAIWIVVGASLSEKDIPLGSDRIVCKADDKWKAVDMSDIQVKAGTALDLSSLVEPGTAGKNGRVIIGKSGQLSFEKAPEKSARFRGSNSFWTLNKLDRGSDSVQAVKDRMTKYAELYHRSGYDIIRLLPMDAYLMRGAKQDGEFNPERLDKMDHFLAELKKNGIYLYLSLAAYNMGRVDGWQGYRETTQVKAKVFLGDPESRARWKICMEQLLNHVNPYTKTAWKDDPVIAAVEPYNEQEFGLFMREKFNDEVIALYEKKWGAWLKSKFGSPEKLAESAKDDKNFELVKNFDSVKIPVYRSGFMANEFLIFQKELASETLDWYTKLLRETGYNGIITQYNMSKEAMYNAVRADASEAISMDGYFAHPSDVTRPGSKCTQSSSVAQAGSYWRGINSTKISGRPFMINEQKHGFWNVYRHENALLFPAYSALQSYDALMVHCDPVLLESEANFDFITAYDPVSMANELAGAFIYKRGDISKADKKVEIRFPADYVLKDCNGGKAVNSEQNKLGLICGFSISFEKSKINNPSFKADMILAADSGSSVGGTLWYQSVEDSKNSKFDLASCIKQMKEKGIIPDSNVSDPANGIFQSMSGEIIMKTKEKMMKIVTQKTEGVSLEAGKGEKLENLNLVKTSIPVMICVSALDNRKLKDSSRMILICATDAVNSGMELSADRTTLINPGGLPVLMETGKFSIELKNSGAERMKIYALGMDGTRKETVPFKAENGILKIELDTATLKNGITPYFEIVKE